MSDEFVGAFHEGDDHAVVGRTDEAQTFEPPVPASPAPVFAAAAPGEYPMVLYHRTLGSLTVQTPGQRATLGPDWFDHPMGTS